jgi:hypothetical protein
MDNTITASDPNARTSQVDVDMVFRSVGILRRDADVSELRGLKTSEGTISGYYRDAAKLADDAAYWSGQASGVYMTLNPVNPSLYERSADTFTLHADQATSDVDVVRRLWLFVDFDPNRQSGVSSTDAEHEAAISRAIRCRDWLSGLGWPEPVLADSGNGAHLLYGINLPNDAPSTTVVEGCLEALDFQFSDETVHVDRKTGNAGRISKIYGTLACKGADDPDRPHRLSGLIDVPDSIQDVPLALLHCLARMVPTEAARERHVGGRSFDLDAWIAKSGLSVVKSGPWRDGRKWVLNPCPWKPEHTNGAAYIVQHPSGGIAAGCHHDGCFGKRWHDLRDVVEPGWRNAAQVDGDDAVDTTAGNKSGERASQADLLVAIAKRCDLFHDDTDVPYARVPVDGHMELWPVGSSKFRSWLGREFFTEYRKAPNGQALAEAENVIAGEALFAGDQRPVYLRIAPDGHGGQYIDLGDPSWRAVHVSAAGWSIVDTPPVCFRRPSGMQALPIPVRGGGLEDLRQFVNLTDDESWALLKAWLIGALYWKGPYPILALQGQQGSAKSTTARMLRKLVDPSKPELRADPRSAEDLAIAAKMNHVVALDNISSIQTWLSDGLCRLATGGGFATRRRYTVEEEALFEAQRPCLITGITRYIDRGDLLERAVQITLPPITDDARQTEEQLWADFEEAQSRLFGALLTRLSRAMAVLPTVKPAKYPRMADFAKLAVAAERGAGETEVFLRAYEGVRESAHEQAIDASPIGATLLVVLSKVAVQEPWRGTMGTLLKMLDTEWGVNRKPYGWPTKPNGLTNEMTRLAPALTGMGIEVVRAGGQRTGGSRIWTLYDPDGISQTFGAAGASAASTASTTGGWEAGGSDDAF